MIEEGVYLDYNSSAPVFPEVKKSILKNLDEIGIGNASSIHKYGRYIQLKIEKSREIIADIFSVKSHEIIFTSGATEANNLVLKGSQLPLIISPIEHSSVIKSRSENTFICQVTNDGLVDLDSLKSILRKINNPCLVSIMYANNETGVIQPIKEVVSLVKSHNSFLHCDIVQAIGKTNSFLNDVKDVDSMSISGHKTGALQGVGALIIKDSLSILPIIHGGGQERGIRPGTENLIGIISLGVALPIALGIKWEDTKVLRDFLEESLIKICPNIMIFGKKISRLPNTTNLTMPMVKNQIQVIYFDLNNIAISAGSACTSRILSPTHVLSAMNIPESIANTAIRISLGPYNTKEDIKKFIKCWKILYLKNMKE